MLTARVHFYKDVERDNYTNGCYGGLTSVHSETLHFAFTDKADLLQQLADWTASRFDVKVSDFMKHVENECDSNRFDYAQPEDADGGYTSITEENPEGFYAMYFYQVSEVYEKINYTF